MMQACAVDSTSNSSSSTSPGDITSSWSPTDLSSWNVKQIIVWCKSISKLFMDPNSLKHKLLFTNGLVLIGSTRDRDQSAIRNRNYENISFKQKQIICSPTRCCSNAIFVYQKQHTLKHLYDWVYVIKSGRKSNWRAMDWKVGCKRNERASGLKAVNQSKGGTGVAATPLHADRVIH